MSAVVAPARRRKRRRSSTLNFAINSSLSTFTSALPFTITDIENIFGHVPGDEVLQLFSTSSTSLTRLFDFCGNSLFTLAGNIRSNIARVIERCSDPLLTNIFSRYAPFIESKHNYHITDRLLAIYVLSFMFHVSDRCVAIWQKYKYCDRLKTLLNTPMRKDPSTGEMTLHPVLYREIFAGIFFGKKAKFFFDGTVLPVFNSWNDNDFEKLCERSSGVVDFCIEYNNFELLNRILHLATIKKNDLIARNVLECASFFPKEMYQYSLINVFQYIIERYFYSLYPKLESSTHKFNNMKPIPRPEMKHYAPHVFTFMTRFSGVKGNFTAFDMDNIFRAFSLFTVMSSSLIPSFRPIMVELFKHIVVTNGMHICDNLVVDENQVQFDRRQEKANEFGVPPIDVTLDDEDYYAAYNFKAFSNRSPHPSVTVDKFIPVINDMRRKKIYQCFHSYIKETCTGYMEKIAHVLKTVMKKIDISYIFSMTEPDMVFLLKCSLNVPINVVDMPSFMTIIEQIRTYIEITHFFGNLGEEEYRQHNMDLSDPDMSDVDEVASLSKEVSLESMLQPLGNHDSIVFDAKIEAKEANGLSFNISNELSDEGKQYPNDVDLGVFQFGHPSDTVTRRERESNVEKPEHFPRTAGGQLNNLQPYYDRRQGIEANSDIEKILIDVRPLCDVNEPNIERWIETFHNLQYPICSLVQQLFSRINVFAMHKVLDFEYHFDRFDILSLPFQVADKETIEYIFLPLFEEALDYHWDINESYCHCEVEKSAKTLDFIYALRVVGVDITKIITDLAMRTMLRFLDRFEDHPINSYERTIIRSVGRFACAEISESNKQVCFSIYRKVFLLSHTVGAEILEPLSFCPFLYSFIEDMEPDFYLALVAAAKHALNDCDESCFVDTSLYCTVNVFDRQISDIHRNSTIIDSVQFSDLQFFAATQRDKSTSIVTSQYISLLNG
ncbi:hypothetical protein PCE1_004119 [Barthelona sp. PCE]